MRNKSPEAPPLFVTNAWELLDLTLLGLADDRAAMLVERLANDIDDEYLRHQLLSTAVRNLSKSCQREAIDRFRAVIARHSAPLAPLDGPDLLETDAIRWSREYLSTLHNSSFSFSESRPGVALNRDLDRVIDFSAATPKWYQQAEVAKESVYQLLNPAINVIIPHCNAFVS